MIASLSLFFFISLSYAASFVATFLADFLDLDEPPRSTVIYVGVGWDWVNPIEVFYNLMRLVTRVLQDEKILGDDSASSFGTSSTQGRMRSPSSLIATFIRRVIIGVPVVGVASLIQLLFSIHLLAPVNMLARYRGRNRRDSSRDIAMIIVLGAVLLGILRYGYYT